MCVYVPAMRRTADGARPNYVCVYVSAVYWSTEGTRPDYVCVHVYYGQHHMREPHRNHQLLHGDSSLLWSLD